MRSSREQFNLCYVRSRNQACKYYLDQQLIAIEHNVDLYYCSNYNFKCIDYRIAIDVLRNSLIECCLKVSSVTIPQTTNGDIYDIMKKTMSHISVHILFL